MQGQPTADLAHFCTTLRGEDLPSSVRERVRYLLLDHLARLIAPFQPGHLPAARGDERRYYYGRCERAEAAWAALANGVAAHGLEMDDVENRSSLHPGVVVFPAVLALAEQLASPPTDIYAAVVAGYEITTLKPVSSLTSRTVVSRMLSPISIVPPGPTGCATR